MDNAFLTVRRLIMLCACLLVGWLLAACGGGSTSGAMPAQVAVTSLPTTVITPTAALTVTTQEPLSPEQAAPPVRLAIPAINLTVNVAPMAWQVTQVQGERRAVWQVPEETAGWHINSAGAGARGNVIISGYHRQGKAVFAPLARGEVTVGQQLLLTDDKGRTFIYQVTEVANPIPVLGATQQDQANATAYLALPTPTASSEAKLTLATGWPEFSDTHYLFIVAKLVGMVP